MRIAQHGLFDLLCVFFNQYRVVVVQLYEVEIAKGHAEQVVQVVGNALGDGAYGCRATRLVKAMLDIANLAVDAHKAQLGANAGQGFSRLDRFGDVVHRANT
jgi:hypothetical protein